MTYTQLFGQGFRFWKSGAPVTVFQKDPFYLCLEAVVFARDRHDVGGVNGKKRIQFAAGSNQGLVQILCIEIKAVAGLLKQ